MNSGFSSMINRQYLSVPFMRENGMNKPGVITLLGKDGSKWLTNLRGESAGRLCLGMGWREFAKANGLKTGESFTLESIWENGIPMLSLFSSKSTSDRTQQGECPKDSEKESFFTEPSSLNKTKKVKNTREERSSRELVRNKCMPNRRDHSLSPTENRFITLRLTHDSLRKGRLHLLLPYMRENGLDKPGVITLLGKDGMKWEANLLRDATGRMSLGQGWRDFAKANGLKIGESFTLESIWENGTPMLSLFSTESTSDTRQQGECSIDREKESFSNKTMEAKNNIEERRDSSSEIQNRFVTLTLTPEDVRDCKLILPSQFMKANNINKLGKLNLLGKNKMKWFGYLLSKDGIVALGCGWKGFCEANGVKIGEAFTLEYIYEQDTAHVFKFCSNSGE